MHHGKEFWKVRREVGLTDRQATILEWSMKSDIDAGDELVTQSVSYTAVVSLHDKT